MMSGRTRLEPLDVHDLIHDLVDEGTFVAETSISTGVAGTATVDGRRVTVADNDKFFPLALAHGTPFVNLASGRGAPLRGGPRNLGTLDPVSGFSAGPMFPELLARRRRVPAVSAIVGNSFGDSTFFTGLADFVVQREGTCVALAGPRVLAIGTGERIAMEDLGGTAVQTAAGLVDVVAETAAEITGYVRRFLSFLSEDGARAFEHEPDGVDGSDSASSPPFEGADDGRRVLADVCDRQSILEVKVGFAPEGAIGFARIGGVAVGFAANVPVPEGKTFSDRACIKITRHVALCDSFGLPLLLILNTRGRERHAIHDGDEPRTARFLTLLKAVHLVAVPKYVVVPRELIGPAFLLLGGQRLARDLTIAWPGARAGFSDDGGGNGSVLELAQLLRNAIVAPAETRRQLIAHLRQNSHARKQSVPSSLSSWPVGF